MLALLVGTVLPAAVATPTSPRLELIEKENLRTGYGVKAVRISPDGSRVYSVNLEEMNVFEFDRRTRRLLRRIDFTPHPGRGYDYQKKVAIDSFEEKPVECCFSHRGRILWLSLHNGAGVVAWDLVNTETAVPGRPFKEVTLTDAVTGNKRKARLLFIPTGKTPKVLVASRDGRWLFVSNWHSHSLTVVDIASADPSGWAVTRTLTGFATPRGMEVSPDNRLLYVAEMGSDRIKVLDLPSGKLLRTIRTGVNPRHLTVWGKVMYVSLNLGARLLKLDLATEQVLASVRTAASPRTVAVSNDGRVVFAVCYTTCVLQAFAGSDLSFLGEWPAQKGTVAVDTWQEGGVLEAWVGNYAAGSLIVYRFGALP
ncbi:MAG: beta-propeller fold lactonase family protein [Acidobacteria bacterium]|nr:beta-propeller fold lactonase family protein [Acidobacteriota bacterium]